MNSESNCHLPPGTRLDRYVVQRRIGGGGFSIVYLARSDDGEPVAIKEYMPLKLAQRVGEAVCSADASAVGPFCQGRRLFLQEAQALSALDHPNIVRVIGFFRANGTVYTVMAYEQGISLQHYIGRKGTLSERLLRTVFPPLLDGLRLVHASGLLHLDIKPANIYLRPGGNPLLLDFGAAHRILRSRRFQPAQVVTPGFSPVEQNEAMGYVGPWTDIYAVGATLRACIAGSAPPSAEERRLRDTLRPAANLYGRNYSKRLLEAVDWAMEVDPLQRPQTVEAFIEALGPWQEESAPAEGFFDRIAGRLRRGFKGEP